MNNAVIGLLGACGIYLFGWVLAVFVFNVGGA